MQSIYYNKNAGVNVWEYQLIQNLNADLWSGYISTATAFAGNVSNVTYAMNAGWNDNCWDYAYRNVMVESLKITNKCKDDMETYAHFEAINTICRVIAMSRLADQYGCIIYSHYGESATGGEYDSGQDAYKKFFEELKEAADVLRTAKEKDVASFMMFDYAYGGNLNKWAQLCNTIRLRLAMRIVKYDAAWAKSEAEAAMNDSNGLIETNDANFGIAGNGYVNPLYGIAFNYGDGVLGANIPSILSGMGDARLDKYATQNSKSEYFGIRLGIKGLEEEGFSDAYKAIVSRPNLTETSPAILATAAETILLEAEAALRGWDVNGKGTAQSLYEKGIRTSFEQWGAAVGDYLSSTTTAAAYVDPVIPAASIEGQSKVTAKWDESLSNEEKFAKIATQRWIAIYPEGMNGWAEIRRTGYPKLFPVMVNYSQGEIDTDLGPRRLPFTINEKGNNPTGYAKAVEMLGGPDEVTVVFAEDVPYRACNGIEFDVMQEFVEGSRLLLTGKAQTLKDFQSGRLLVYILADFVAVSEKAVEQDEAAVRGVIANKPTYRETPRGKRITDITVKVRNELTGGNCYLPCICWQEQADEAAQWQQGDTVELLGRYQSRQYEKVLDAATGEREQRTAYEVSVRLIRRKEEEENEC